MSNQELVYKNESIAKLRPQDLEKADQFCQEYKEFLDNGKTEREAAAFAAATLEKAGYLPFQPGKQYQPGDKFYKLHRNKCILAATLGTKSLEEGVHINAAHIDAPRLDLRPVPLYESSEMAFFRTHYYGGIRKYQWATIPLAIHGVVYTRAGEKVEICVGEKESDPVFCITDLLPHLSARQNERTLPEGIKGEELNLVVGCLPVEGEEAKDQIKLNVLKLLNQEYGITEEDFIRGELEVVPAHKARDIGFDRGMIGAYGHDDRVDAYPALMAEIDTQAPAFTTLCVLTDKEEIGSEGVTGLNSQYMVQFIHQLCNSQKADYITTLQNSKCLSADVTAAYDPNWADAFEPNNSTYAGKGIALCKYTGARGKSGASDASAELVSYVTRLLEAEGVVWQMGELGKVDLGGGGTVAKYVASHDIETLDIGVPVLSMHSPFEVVSKGDVYMAYRAFLAFNKAEA